MVLAAFSPSDATTNLGFLSFLYLMLVLLCICLLRSVELKLIALGLLTAVLSVWCAQMPGEGMASIQVGPGPAGAGGRVVAGGDVTGTLGRIAVLLILGGLVVMSFRWGFPSSTAQKEEPSRANPS